MGNSSSIECIKININLYTLCIETYREYQALLKTMYDLDYDEQAKYDLEFERNAKKLKNIISKIISEINNIEHKCDLKPLYKAINIVDTRDKNRIKEKYGEINDTIKKLESTIQYYKQQLVLKFKLKSIKKSKTKKNQKKSK